VSAANGHEPHDVAARPVLLAGLALATVLLLVAGGQLLLLRHYEREATERASPAAPLAEVRTPPEPRLLPNPRGALLELHAEEDTLLHGYGWVNREAGIVRIPIERAIDVLAASSGRAPAR
jgi:hypothetical protein